MLVLPVLIKQVFLKGRRDVGIQMGVIFGREVSPVYERGADTFGSVQGRRRAKESELAELICI